MGFAFVNLQSGSVTDVARGEPLVSSEKRFHVGLGQRLEDLTNASSSDPLTRQEGK